MLEILLGTAMSQFLHQAKSIINLKVPVTSCGVSPFFLWQTGLNCKLNAFLILYTQRSHEFDKLALGKVKT
jgi:hypothetical protein